MKIQVNMQSELSNIRGGSRTAATFKMERFVIIFNGWKSLTIITKRSILDITAVLDRSLNIYQAKLVAKNTVFGSPMT